MYQLTVTVPELECEACRKAHSATPRTDTDMDFRPHQKPGPRFTCEEDGDGHVDTKIHDKSIGAQCRESISLLGCRI